MDKDKPDNIDDRQKLCLNLNGPDGNIFVIIARSTQLLAQVGRGVEAKEMKQEVFSSKSYEEALTHIRRYINLIEVS